MFEVIKFLYRKAKFSFLMWMSICVILEAAIILSFFNPGDFFQHFKLRYAVAGGLLLSVLAAVLSAVKYYWLERRPDFK